MDITLVVTAFNDQETVMDTVESVLSQSRLPDELGLVLGDSRDRTEEFAFFYREEFDFVKRNLPVDWEHRGQAQLRLAGLGEASREYVLFMPAGGFLYRNAVERFGETVSGSGEVIGGGATVLTGRGEEVEWSAPSRLDGEQFHQLGPAHPGCFLWKRDLLRSMKAELETLRLGPFTTLGWLILAGENDALYRREEGAILEDWSFLMGATCWRESVYSALENLEELADKRDLKQRIDVRDWVESAMGVTGGPPAKDFLGTQPGERDKSMLDSLLRREENAAEWVARRIDFVE